MEQLMKILSVLQLTGSISLSIMNFITKDNDVAIAWVACGLWVIIYLLEKSKNNATTKN